MSGVGGMEMPVGWPSFVTGRRLEWERDGRDWPNREASRFVRAGGLRWHVQELGAGPVLLLLHGTGASTHSWRSLAPRLAEHFTVVAPDLPGHGFTQAAPARALSLAGMARALAALLEELGHRPAVAVGHSAGAALTCRMSLDGLVSPGLLVSLNGSLRPLEGLAHYVYSPIAKLLTWNPILPRVVAWRAGNPAVVGGMLRDTGSRLDPEGVELYERLARSPQHVAGALRMMASWDVAALARELPRLEPRLLLIVGENDRMVPPRDAERVRERVADAQVEALPGLGHLAHEERPGEVADLVIRHARPVLTAGDRR